MLAYLYGHLLLFRFAIGHLPLLFSLPGWLTDPAELERRLATLRDGTVQSLTLNFPSDQADAYNIALKQLGSKMQALHPQQMTASTRVFLLNLIRFSTVVAAWHGNIGLTLGVAITQFLIAPYSLFVSITAGLALIFYLLLPHYLAFAGLQYFTSFIPQSPWFSWLTAWGQIPITPFTISLFVLVDQMLCLLATLTPEAATYPSSKSWTKILSHALHGFINSKTMTLVVLFLCMHHHPTLSIWLWLVEGFLVKATTRISGLLSSCSLHPNVLFYHQHRMAHLPVVYQHAHKLHHTPGHMAVTAAFDASLYGCGMPEEFFVLAAELLLLTMGIPPASLGCYVLFSQGLSNKHSHTIKGLIKDGEGGEKNFHTDHHLTHTKNYGSSATVFHCLPDLYFSTAARKGGHWIPANKKGASTSTGREVMVKAVVEPGHKDTTFVFTAEHSLKRRPVLDTTTRAPEIN